MWDFDKTYWPDPKGMADELRAMGVKLFVSVWPTVDPRSPYYGEMIEKGYIVHTDRGGRTMLECGGYETFMDTTNPDARAYVWDKLKKSYYDCGIKNYWLDCLLYTSRCVSETGAVVWLTVSMKWRNCPESVRETSKTTAKISSMEMRISVTCQTRLRLMFR